MSNKSNFLFSKKVSVFLLAGVIGFSGSSVYANSPTDSRRLTFGIGGDVAYFAVAGSVSYRVHDYVGLSLGFQSTISSNVKNILAEEQLVNALGAEYLSSKFKYVNYAIPFTVDFYPLKNYLRASIGVGYMERQFQSKVHSSQKAISNPDKLILIAGLGYQGFFSPDSSFGYSMDVRGVMVNKKLVKSHKDLYKIEPTILLSLNYSM